MIRDFIRKPRNIYFSIVTLLTVVTCLISISFSFYIDESNDGYVNISKLDNRIQSDLLNNGDITVNPNSTITFNLYVMSNNDFDSVYKVMYQCNENVYVKSLSHNGINIGSHDVHEVKVQIENTSNDVQNIHFGIISGYNETDLNTTNKTL